jgi:cyclophilin family peptidyl-prolyl cis-trans isomerase
VGLLVLGLLAGVVPAVRAAPPAPRVGDERILLRTNRGDLVLGLYPDVAPRTSAQILRLVRLGVYDSTWFHRLEPNFVLQLTNAQNRKQPLTPEQLKAIEKLPAEFSAVPHRPGILSMAREDDVNSAETSFSILLGPAPHLDGKYTVFGQIEWGMPLVGILSGEPRDDKNAPLREIVVESAAVKTAAEIARMIQAGELKAAVRLPGLRPTTSIRLDRTAQPVGSTGLSNLAIVAVVLMLVFNLIGFVFGHRWPPQTRGALNLLPVLVGSFLLLSELGPRAARVPALGLALFAGVVALFKLMNRFESAPPPDRPAAK